MNALRDYFALAPEFVGKQELVCRIRAMRPEGSWSTTGGRPWCGLFRAVCAVWAVSPSQLSSPSVITLHPVKYPQVCVLCSSGLLAAVLEEPLL